MDGYGDEAIATMLYIRHTVLVKGTDYRTVPACTQVSKYNCIKMMGGLDMVALLTGCVVAVVSQWAHCRAGRRIPETMPLIVVEV